MLWINAHSPNWLYEPMLFVTTLGYYWVFLPLLVLVAYVFPRIGAKTSAVLLPIATLGSLILPITLKSLVQRARPKLFDAGYATSLYSFPSAHATVAASFYGTLALLLARRLKGFGAGRQPQPVSCLSSL